MNKFKMSLAFAAFTCLVGATSAQAGAISSSSILVSNMSNGQLTEHSRNGALRQSFATPDFESGFHDLRDIVLDLDGNVQMFNGTFTPRLSTLNPTTGAIANRSMAGWSTVNNVSYGGIAAAGKQVFVTDMRTFNGGAEAAGIVMFDLESGTARRFADGRDYHDLNLGHDGLLYATTGRSADVYDPRTFTFVRNVTWEGAGDVRGIAIDKSGTIFTASWGGAVSRYDSAGRRVGNTLNVDASLTDIDINARGDIVLGSRFGTVFLTDSTLRGPSSFNVGGSFGPTVHVAFAEAVMIPEPSSVALLLAGLAIAGANVARRKGRRV